MNETMELTRYFDEDRSGDIDYLEFIKKINLGDMQQKANIYTISKISFIDLMLKEWDNYISRERKKLIDLFQKFDDNGDGVLVLDEFGSLVKSLEPSLKKNAIVKLFKQTLEKFESNEIVDDDKLSPEAFCQMVWYNKLGNFGKEFYNDYFRTKQQNPSQQNRRLSTIKKSI